MEILFKNVTTLNKDEYIELIKFHGKKGIIFNTNNERNKHRNQHTKSK